jgi:hypothetical protein
METTGKCNICKEVYTKTSIEIDEGEAIFVCGNCIETAKDNFIWICICCGKTYIRPKVACSPERILDIMETQYNAAEC